MMYAIRCDIFSQWKEGHQPTHCLFNAPPDCGSVPLTWHTSRGSNPRNSQTKKFGNHWSVFTGDRIISWLTIGWPYLTGQAIHVQARSRNHCCGGKAVIISYSECVPVSLVSQHQSACAVLYCHLWPVWTYHIFLHFLTNGTIFGKKLLHTKCVFRLYLQLMFKTFLILRIIQRDMIKNVYWSSWKTTRYSCQI